VNGREFDGSLLRQAVEDAAKTTTSITLIVKDGDYYKTLSLDYHDGEKYPHLERDTSKPDILGEIIKPHAVAK
jgi:hypothetical protein